MRDKKKPGYSLKDERAQTGRDAAYKKEAEAYFAESHGNTVEKLDNFPRFVSRQSLSLFLAKHEIFQRVLHVHGSIIECGVFMGGGLFTWLQLSAIYEPVNYNRKVIGFDTFEGFPSLTSEDEIADHQHMEVGGYSFPHDEEISRGASMHDLTRPIGHIPKLELVKGDATQTIPDYIEKNPHTVVSMLYLDFDLYEPTLAALRHLYPRIPSGGVIAFDELNQVNWPGETMAVLEEVGLNKLGIRRVPYTPSVSYAVLE